MRERGTREVFEPLNAETNKLGVAATPIAITSRTVGEAQLLVEDWRQEYNHYRPHRSLDYQTPAEYARHWRTETQPAPS